MWFIIFDLVVKYLLLYKFNIVVICLFVRESLVLFLMVWKVVYLIFVKLFDVFLVSLICCIFLWVIFIEFNMFLSVFFLLFGNGVLLFCGISIF